MMPTARHWLRGSMQQLTRSPSVTKYAACQLTRDAQVAKYAVLQPTRTAAGPIMNSALRIRHAAATARLGLCPQVQQLCLDQCEPGFLSSQVTPKQFPKLQKIYLTEPHEEQDPQQWPATHAAWNNWWLWNNWWDWEILYFMPSSYQRLLGIQYYYGSQLFEMTDSQMQALWHPHKVEALQTEPPPVASSELSWISRRFV